LVLCRVLMPPEYVGPVMQLCMEKRGRGRRTLRYLGSQVQLDVEMPLQEVVIDFFDRLKSGVARLCFSFEYHFLRFQAADLVKLDILVNGDKVDAPGQHRPSRQTPIRRGPATCARKMQESDPPASNSTLPSRLRSAPRSSLARRSKALRKDVIAKCYGGDVSPQAQAAGEAEGRQEAHESRSAPSKFLRKPSWPSSACKRNHNQLNQTHA